MESWRSSRRFMAGAAVILAAALPQTSRADVRFDASITVEAAHSSRLDIDVWTNKEEGGVYRQGEPMPIFFRPSADAFVLIYNIDTEGYIHLVYPYGPDDPDRLEGGRTYQVPSRNDPYDLVADGPTGIEYVVALASPFPFRDLPWYLTGGYDSRELGREYRDNDDEGDSGVIVGDPYVGMDRVVRRVVPPGREDEVATADTYFYIDRRVEYPRYVCADCHSYGGWYDPYGDICTVVDIRIDAGWSHYRPLRSAVLRPRYFYRVRESAPTRYRQWKERWSSVDGRSTLRTRFRVDGTDKFRTRRQIIEQRTPPEFRGLRRPRDSRLWRPNEVLRRERGDERRDRDVRRDQDARRDQDTRRREWTESRQRRDEHRREEAQRRDDQRRDERSRNEWRDRERARSEERQDSRRREDARREESRREESRRDEGRERREQARERRDESQDRDRRDEARERREERQEDRGERDRGRSEDRRRDDGDRDRGRGQEQRDWGRGRR